MTYIALNKLRYVSQDARKSEANADRDLYLIYLIS